jgi:hypothetical protein
VRPARLRRGEAVVLLGLIGLLGSLFLEWFRSGAYSGRTGDRIDVITSGTSSPTDVLIGAQDGWGTLGHPWIELLVLFVLAAVLVLVIALRTGPGRSTYAAVVSLVLSVAFGWLVLLLIALRALAFRPGVDVVTPAGAVTIHPSPAIGAWVGLAGLLVAVVGLWLALADDRTDAAESDVPPPPASPVPPARPAPEAEPARTPDPAPPGNPGAPAAG